MHRTAAAVRALRVLSAGQGRCARRPGPPPCRGSRGRWGRQQSLWTLARSPYEVLGIRKGAAEDEIKKAYFNLAKTCHPDLNDDESSHKRFQEVSAAYELLTDEDELRAYEAGVGARNDQHKPRDAREAFNRVFKDIRMTNPVIAMEERAMYAVIEMQRGNQMPTVDFVIDYRIPPHHCLPKRQQLEAEPAGEPTRGARRADSGDGGDPDRMWHSHRRIRKDAEDFSMATWMDQGSDHPGGG